MLKYVEKDVAEKLESILNEIGIDADTVIRMTLKKICREQSIDFLISAPQSNTTYAVEAITANEKPSDIKMTKSRAISLFLQEGVKIPKNTTFSSKNRTTLIYWSNPYFDVLKKDWYLILNDWVNRELHLFIVPEKSIRQDELKPRGDAKHMIDLQIAPDDPTFTDNRSKLSFKKYLTKTINY